MGIQGMKNWKFSVFFVIALTLVAGLFADTAIAASGDGKMLLGLTNVTNLTEAATPDNAPAIPQVLVAGSTATLTFTYTALDANSDPINMNGGKVRIDIPADWKFKVSQITSVTDGDTNLYLTTARLSDDTTLTAPYNIRGPALKQNRGLRRVKLALKDDNVTGIEVELHASGWGVDRSARSLVITLGNTATTRITVPIPASLPSTLTRESGVHFMNYAFTTSSASKTGSFQRLKPNDADSTPTHPEVKVGNVPNTTGGDSAVFAVTATPDPTKIYVGDEGDLTIKVTARGPIYDVDRAGNGNVGTDSNDVDARIVVSFAGTADDLKILPSPFPNTTYDHDTNNETAAIKLPPPPAIATTHVNAIDNLSGFTGSTPQRTTPGAAQITNRGRSGYVSITDKSKVVLGNPALTVSNNEVTINVVKMDKDGYVDLTYEKMWAAQASSGNFVVVSVASSSNSLQPIATVGSVVARPGTGTIEMKDAAVEVNTLKNFTITYTADTSIEGAYLAVRIPANVFKMPNPTDDTQLVALTLTDGKTGTYPRTGDASDSPYGKVTMVTTLRNVQQSLHQQTADDATAYTDYNTIIWGPLSLKKGGKFQGKISKVRITDTTGVHNWPSSLEFATTRPTDLSADAALALPNQSLHVLQAAASPDDPDVTFEINSAKALPLSTLGSDSDADAGVGGFSSYSAAGRYRLTFRFTAVKTPINKGNVSLKLPAGWSVPNKDKGTPGYTTTSAGTLGVSGQTITITKLDLVTNATVDIVYGAKTDPDDAVTDDMVGAFAQPDAGNEVITSRFDVDGDGSIDDQASNEVNLVVGNVAAGSGTATITPSTVDAGSIVSLTAEFKAQGQMDGGQVHLQMPDNWGDLQADNKDKKNYVQVTPSGGTLTAWDTSADKVRVTFKAFDEGDTVRFQMQKVVAQPSQLGVASFKIYSAGSSGESLELVVGQQPPDGAYTNEGEITAKLLGRVYTTDCIDNRATAAREDYNGFLRVAVTGGGDGSGTATVSIEASENSGDYEIEGATVKGVRQLHAGDGAKTHLQFTYTPIETITDGALKFTVPSSAWADPQTDSPNTTGFIQVNSAGRIGSADASGSSVTIPIYLINRNDTITIDYGAVNGGVTPPTIVKTEEEFTIEVKGSATGSFKKIPESPKLVVPGLADTVDLEIRPQATGKGTATVTAAAVGTDSNVYAGDMGRSFTITYTSVGQVVNGDLRITVPDKWSKAMAAHFDTISGGTATYGGDMTAAQRAADDPVDNYIDDDAKGERQLIVSGINLSAGETYTVTYKDVTVQSTKADGVAFGIEFRGNAGPGTDFGPVGTPTGQDNAQKVNVMDVKPGSGTVAVKGPAVITSGSIGNNVTITYTAAAQISAGKQIKVTVPTGWSAPINDAAATDKMGTYTVKHMNADGTVKRDRYGDIIDGNITKLAPSGMMMIAQVSGDVAAGEMIVFTYQNATAPTTPGKSEFQVTFDDVVVESDADTVIVQSAAGVSKLGLEAKDEDENAIDSFIIDSGGTLTVTVELQAADDSVATRSTDTAITLSSSSSTGSFDPTTVTIKAGEYMGTSVYSDTTVGNVTLNASTAVTDIADAAPLAIKANTANPTISSVTFSPMAVKDGDAVTVTALGTPFQTATFMIENIHAAGGGGVSMTDDGDGTYTGAYTLANGSAEGMHTVTVTINGTSMAATGKLTVDNTDPVVSVTAPTAGANVENGEEITISATVTDATAAMVMADVSMLDSEAAADSVTLSPDATDNTKYTGMHTISAANTKANGDYTITVTATDAAGNTGEGTVSVKLDNTLTFKSMIASGANLFHVPLNDPDITTVGDLRTALGDSVTSIIIRRDGGWDPDPDDVMITSDLGIYLVATSDIEHTFEGDAWVDTTINLESGANLVGLPVNDPSVTMASDISGLFADGVVLSVTVGSGGQYTPITAATDVAVAGDAAYYIVAGDVTGGKGTATLTGDGWANGDAANAAPIALSGYRIESQTPALAVYGSVTDEITGLAKEGFRVKVKNLTTKVGLSELTSVETAEGYSMAFVDLKDARAARIGDILEISADSPTPLIGVKPVRHVVTVDDVKNGRITLEDLIAYEIPAETELLRNYPNPFNPETWIPYHLSEDADVKLTIYDVNGALVRDIDVGHQTAAKYDTRAKAIYWDGRNQFGEQVASGIYFYSLEAGDFSATRKMVILK